MIVTYLPDQMLRNLEPRLLTKAQQREADEHLGAAVAAISRRTGHVSRRVDAWARQIIMTDQRASIFRKSGDQNNPPRAASVCQDRDNFAHVLRK